MLTKAGCESSGMVIWHLQTGDALSLVLVQEGHHTIAIAMLSLSFSLRLYLVGILQQDSVLLLDDARGWRSSRARPRWRKRTSIILRTGAPFHGLEVWELSFMKLLFWCTDLDSFIFTWNFRSRCYPSFRPCREPRWARRSIDIQSVCACVTVNIPSAAIIASTPEKANSCSSARLLQGVMDEDSNYIRL